MSTRISSRGRVCRRVLSVRPVSGEANEGWKGRLRPKCGLNVSSLFPNESTSQALYCPQSPSITLQVVALRGREWAGSAPDRGQARAGGLLSTAGAFYYQLYRLKKSPPAALVA